MNPWMDRNKFPSLEKPDTFQIYAKSKKSRDWEDGGVGRVIGVAYLLQPARPPLKGGATLVCSRCYRPADRCRADCSEMGGYWLGLAAQKQIL